MTRPSYADLALAAVLDGLNTSPDIAAELGITVSRAGKIIWHLRRQGYLRATDRRVPCHGHNGGGNPRIVYETT